MTESRNLKCPNDFSVLLYMGVLYKYMLSFYRVDQRGFSVLRSDAELKELMFELYNKEEAPARYRKTHAIIPPMLIDERDQRVMFHSTNGHISDVMAVHKDLKFSNIWIDEEKAIFREK